jgi:NADH-quinone oxidoreductase subunit L
MTGVMEHSTELVPAAWPLLRWVVLAPALGAALLLVFGARMQALVGRLVTAAIPTIAVFGAFAVAVQGFLALAALPETERLLLDSLAPWIHVGALQADLAFALDPLSAVMCLVITGIGGLIHVYSIGYMDEEPSLWRFMGLLNLFVAFMLVLVLGDNLLLMFVGWEGVGLCSWALIGFWYRDHANTRAANKAFLVNRIGDFAFLCGMMLLFWSLASVDAATVVFRELGPAVAELAGQTLWRTDVVTVVALLLFAGATGKSAQIPLFVWLPDAMAGPTPVSALIHAATMVTAGVYMVARLSALFAAAPLAGDVIAWTGAATALMAATIALTQNDIKKVLAYSTVSQLGYMFVAMGVGAYSAGVFHLVTHAFFKACLFLGAGSVIHALHHEQDMRRMGGLAPVMPLTFATYLLSTLAIAGVPPLSGFVSKDEILWKAWQHDPALWAVGAAAATMTAFYMFRQVFLVFGGESRVEPKLWLHVHESPAAITLVLVVLAAGASVAGALALPPALGGADAFGAWLAPVVGAAHGAGHGVHHVETVEYVLMATSVGLATAGIVLAWLIYGRATLSADTFAAIAGGLPYRLSSTRFRFDEIYEATFLAGTLALSRGCAWFDRTIVDGIVNGQATTVRALSAVGATLDRWIVDGAVNALGALAMSAGGAARRLQTGSINAYLFVAVAAVVCVLVAGAW